MQTISEENKENRSGIEIRKQGKTIKKSLKPKTYLQLWTQSLVTKFLNPMIKGKGQRSNELENICKHAETVWLNIFPLQMMISILLWTFRHGNKSLLTAEDVFFFATFP